MSLKITSLVLVNLSCFKKGTGRYDGSFPFLDVVLLVEISLASYPGILYSSIELQLSFPHTGADLAR